MADHDHPIMAGIFVAALAGAIGFGVSKVAGKPVKTHAPAAAAAHDPSHDGVVPPREEIPPPDPDAPPLDPLHAKIMEAVMLGEDGQLDVAAMKLANVVNEHPDNIEALFNLGVALTGLDRLDEADKAFAQVLKLDPKDYEAMAERASIRMEQKKIDEAVSLASAIPAGEGRFNLRLEHDPRWVEQRSDPRVAALRKKHGLKAETTTAAAPAN